VSGKPGRRKIKVKKSFRACDVVQSSNDQTTIDCFLFFFFFFPSRSFSFYSFIHPKKKVVVVSDVEDLKKKRKAVAAGVRSSGPRAERAPLTLSFAQKCWRQPPPPPGNRIQSRPLLGTTTWSVVCVHETAGRSGGGHCRGGRLRAVTSGRCSRPVPKGVTPPSRGRGGGLPRFKALLGGAACGCCPFILQVYAVRSRPHLPLLFTTTPNPNPFRPGGRGGSGSSAINRQKRQQASSRLRGDQGRGPHTHTRTTAAAGEHHQHQPQRRGVRGCGAERSIDGVVQRARGHLHTRLAPAQGHTPGRRRSRPPRQRLWLHAADGGGGGGDPALCGHAHRRRCPLRCAG
jgi:hypothetical protein